MSQLLQIINTQVSSGDMQVNVPSIISGLGLTRRTDARMPSTDRRERRRNRSNRH